MEKLQYTLEYSASNSTEVQSHVTVSLKVFSQWQIFSGAKSYKGQVIYLVLTEGFKVAPANIRHGEDVLKTS